MIPLASHVRTCSVYLVRDSSRYAHTTSASSIFEAARNALKFWRDPFWQGPKPRLDDVLEISVTGDDRMWRVLVSRIDAS